MGLFAGAAYIAARDDGRLERQRDRVFYALKGAGVLTLRNIAEVTGDPEASISAQIRHLRKPKHGAHTVDKIHIINGLYGYRLTPNDTDTPSDSA
jgi:hypothetical protein